MAKTYWCILIEDEALDSENALNLSVVQQILSDGLLLKEPTIREVSEALMQELRKLLE